MIPGPANSVKYSCASPPNCTQIGTPNYVRFRPLGPSDPPSKTPQPEPETVRYSNENLYQTFRKKERLNYEDFQSSMTQTSPSLTSGLEEASRELQNPGPVTNDFMEKVQLDEYQKAVVFAIKLKKSSGTGRKFFRRTLQWITSRKN